MVEEWWEWWRSKQGTGKAGGVCPPPHSYSLSPLTFNDVLFVQNINVNRTVAEADLTDPGWGSTGQVQVRRGEAESDLDLTCTTSAGVARGSTLPTPLKSTKVKSRYNEAKPSCTWTWPRWTWAEVVRGGHQRLHSSPPRPSPGTTRRSRVVPGLGRGGLELKLYEVVQQKCEMTTLFQFF